MPANLDAMHDLLNRTVAGWGGQPDSRPTPPQVAPHPELAEEPPPDVATQAQQIRAFAQDVESTPSDTQELLEQARKIYHHFRLLNDSAPIEGITQLERLLEIPSSAFGGEEQRVRDIFSRIVAESIILGHRRVNMESLRREVSANPSNQIAQAQLDTITHAFFQAEFANIHMDENTREALLREASAYYTDEPNAIRHMQTINRLLYDASQDAANHGVEVPNVKAFLATYKRQVLQGEHYLQDNGDGTFNYVTTRDAPLNAYEAGQRDAIAHRVEHDLLPKNEAPLPSEEKVSPVQVEQGKRTGLPVVHREIEPIDYFVPVNLVGGELRGIKREVLTVARNAATEGAQHAQELAREHVPVLRPRIPDRMRRDIYTNPEVLVRQLPNGVVEVQDVGMLYAAVRHMGQLRNPDEAFRPDMGVTGDVVAQRHGELSTLLHILQDTYLPRAFGYASRADIPASLLEDYNTFSEVVIERYNPSLSMRHQPQAVQEAFYRLREAFMQLEAGGPDNVEIRGKLAGEIERKLRHIFTTHILSEQHLFHTDAFLPPVLITYPPLEENADIATFVDYVVRDHTREDEAEYPPKRFGDQIGASSSTNHRNTVQSMEDESERVQEASAHREDAHIISDSTQHIIGIVNGRDAAIRIVEDTLQRDATPTDGRQMTHFAAIARDLADEIRVASTEPHDLSISARNAFTLARHVAENGSDFVEVERFGTENVFIGSSDGSVRLVMRPVAVEEARRAKQITAEQADDFTMIMGEAFGQRDLERRLLEEARQRLLARGDRTGLLPVVQACLTYMEEHKDELPQPNANRRKITFPDGKQFVDPYGGDEAVFSILDTVVKRIPGMRLTAREIRSRVKRTLGYNPDILGDIEYKQAHAPELPPRVASAREAVRAGEVVIITSAVIPPALVVGAYRYAHQHNLDAQQLIDLLIQAVYDTPGFTERMSQVTAVAYQIPTPMSAPPPAAAAPSPQPVPAPDPAAP